MPPTRSKTPGPSRKGGRKSKQPTGPVPAYLLSLEVENVRCFGPRQRLDLSDGEGLLRRCVKDDAEYAAMTRAALKTLASRATTEP